MARRGISEKERLLDARAATWAGLRVVVVVVEPTGLNVTRSRVVSVALAEIQAGRVLGGYATLVDPGLDTIGASSIHHITVDTIKTAAAPTFASVAPVLLDRLTARDSETVLLAGHNILFDALMLNAELDRLGLALPRLGCWTPRRSPHVPSSMPAASGHSRPRSAWSASTSTPRWLMPASPPVRSCSCPTACGSANRTSPSSRWPSRSTHPPA